MKYKMDEIHSSNNITFNLIRDRFKCKSKKWYSVLKFKLRLIVW